MSKGSALDVKGLNVYYGQSHALQGVDLGLEAGVLSVVGRNGMGKTTLCKAIMGLEPASAGAISLYGQSLVGKSPADIARLGIGYVPQGRHLWKSLTVDEHLHLVATRGPWSVERIYSVFPRLAERKLNGGGQLSGGEQQMLAIGRALLLNPKLLLMDEPTEGLAPVIVNQVTEMLSQLASDGEMDILMIEQNIGVACAVSDRVAIMINGRINRIMDSSVLAADKELQQALLGVGRHGHDETPDVSHDKKDTGRKTTAGNSVRKIYLSNPTVPDRWTQPVPAKIIARSARTVTNADTALTSQPTVRDVNEGRSGIVYVCGTLDTKGVELRFMRDVIKATGVRTQIVDLSTTGKPSGAEVPPNAVAAMHPRGATAVFTGDRGTAVAGMTLAFERWVASRNDIAGVVGAGGSGGTALVAPGFRSLPVGVPKVIVSTVASGNTEQYVGSSDMLMMHSVADVQGINSITRVVLGNAAEAVAGMAAARAQPIKHHHDKPALGMTMFGVTTQCVSMVSEQLSSHYDCLVFHATGTGGRSMEKLMNGGQLAAVLDLTTTEVADMVAGGVFSADQTRFDSFATCGKPYIGACGALDMVNFNAPDTVPAHYANRLFYEHNPQITLMRTTVDECKKIGKFIGDKLNQINSPVRFFLNEGGVSMLDAPGQAFWDPAADAALFTAIENTVVASSQRQLIRVPHNINDPAFAELVVQSFRSLNANPVSVQKTNTNTNQIQIQILEERNYV